LFHEDFQPLCSDFDRHQVMASQGHSEVHTTKQKYFHIETFGGDLQIKKRCFLSLREEFFSRHEVVPYPISPCLGNQQVFLGSFTSSQHSRMEVTFQAKMKNKPLQRNMVSVMKKTSMKHIMLKIQLKPP
jgi:hypothetical protein